MADLRLMLSLGHCRQPPSCTLLETIRRADLALYQAKGNGRNRRESWQDDGLEKPG